MVELADTLGSDPTAAGGGCREGSEWPRSARDEGGNAEDNRRVPQQDVIVII